MKQSIQNQIQILEEEGLRGERVGVSLWFTIGGLGEPNIYHDLGVFYKNGGILLGFPLTL